MTIFFCRFIPLIRSLISIPAGSAKMKLPHFLILTTLGTLIWNIVLVFLGRTVGDNWESIAAILDTYSNYTVIALGLLATGFVLYFLRKRVFVTNKKNKKKSANSFFKTHSILQILFFRIFFAFLESR